MVFMNYTAALKLTRKIILLQFLSDCGVKTRPSQNKVLISKFSPSPTLSYNITKKTKKVFYGAKFFKVLKLLRVHSGRVLFRVLRDSVVFRFLSDWVFFRFLFLLVLSDRVLFESSVKGSSKGSSVIDSSLGYQSSFSSMPVLFY